MVCVLALLAATAPATAAQLSEAEPNEVKHVDAHGIVHFDLPPPSKTSAAARRPGTGRAAYYIKTESGLMQCCSDFIRAGAYRLASITTTMKKDPFPFPGQ
jgi:hypothetical protein